MLVLLYSLGVCRCKFGDEDYTVKISPKKAQKMLKEEGFDVTLEQAEEISYFLRKLPNIQLIHYFEKNNF